MALHGHWSRLAILAAMSRGELSGAGGAASLRHPLSKVPEVTVYFWITKVLTTGMGEATSDYLVHRINPKIASFEGLIIGLVDYMAVSGKDVMVRHAAPGPADRAAADPGPDVLGRPVQAAGVGKVVSDGDWEPGDTPVMGGYEHGHGP